MVASLEAVRVCVSTAPTALKVLATHEASVHILVAHGDGAQLLEIKVKHVPEGKNKQTSKQANKQTNKQANKQISKQANAVVAQCQCWHKRTHAKIHKREVER